MGGRQSSMLAAEQSEVCDGLLLLSYPLHPPRKPEQLRTQHLPDVRTPALFVHGTRDPFGLPDEMEQARSLLKGPAVLSQVEGRRDTISRPASSMSAGFSLCHYYGCSAKDRKEQSRVTTRPA